MNNKYNRRNFLKIMSAGAAAIALPNLQFCSKEKLKPNIVLINVDDLGWTDVACFGSGYYETPNIDKLAAQGMRFTDNYAACAVCSPTRASIMTGRYPARIGVTDWIHHLDTGADQALSEGGNPAGFVKNDNRKLMTPENAYFLDLEEVTIAEMLKKAGYTTCHVGKWHLGHEPWFPDKQGFDYNYGGTEIGQPPSYFDPYHLNEQRPDIATLPARQEGEYLTDRESDEAVNFIRDHAGKSFFLNMCHYAVHTPIQAKAEKVEKYKNKQPAGGHKNPDYAAMIESVDEAAGRILETLDELDLTDNTMVIFTSDNGGHVYYPVTDNSPLRSGKGFAYEGGIRVPLIVRWPGVIQPGTVENTPISSQDFFPTICEAAGSGLPKDRTIDGVSILPLFKQAGDLSRKSLFWHFPHYRVGGVMPYSIIRDGDWKLIKRYDGKPFELYNLKEDLGETEDLSEAMPDKLRELDSKLQKWLKESGAKMPVDNPDYIGN